MKSFYKLRNQIVTLLALAGIVSSCSEDTIVNSVLDNESYPININAEYPVAGVGTRATDNGFVQDDAVGIFVVDYDKDGTPQDLLAKGNRADNVKFAFNGATWEANYQLYWASKSTPADFYGYYPFNQSLSSITEYPFAVYTNQDGTTSEKANYEQSDLLWAKTEKVQPTIEKIPMQYRHLMAGITIQLQMGTGFDAAEWAQLEKIVLVDNVLTSSTVNLQTGKVTAKTSAETDVITPYLYNNTWRVVVVPQTVAAGKRVLNITVDGKNYALIKEEAVEYVSGKMHNFTITVNKNTSTGDYTFKLTADDIVAWVDDAEMHDGLVRQYLIVDVNEPGTLAKVMAYRGIDPAKVTALKIVGNINGDDLGYVKDHCTHLADYNLSRAIIADGVLCNLGIGTMHHFVFPEKSVERISSWCFVGAGLDYQTLNLPEGIVSIDHWSFGDWNCRFIGELRYPSTLRYCETNFGNSTTFTGELLLPEGIKKIQSPAGDFTGSLYFPESLEEISGGWGYPNITGTLTIPRFMTKVDGFNGIGCTSVVFHDGVTEINGLSGTQIIGELVLPPNLTKIGGGALGGNKISKIIFNDNLKLMGDGAFGDNPYLSGTLELPKNVARIPSECFIGCSGIAGIVIPANVDLIDARAFKWCNGISSIVCEGTEPPFLGEEAFYGVNKDNFTVEVPKGCVDKYKEAEGWKEFKRIAEYSNFVCRPAHANALNNAHSEDLVLNADAAWTVTSCPDWIRLSKTSGTGKSEIQLTFKDMPHGSGNREARIVFQMGDVETYCDVTQYDYQYEEDSYLTLQTHTEGNGLDLIFLGDGWTGEHISNGDYLAMVKEQMEYFFGIEPLKSHREYFNVYVAFPLSQEKGVNTMYTYVNNRFGTLYGYDGTWGTIDQLITETDEVFHYAYDNTPAQEGNRWKSQIILIPNSEDYESVSYFWDNTALSLCPPSTRPYPRDNRGIVQHEAAGHGFGKLGDENIAHQAWATPDILGIIEDYHDRGWYQNLSTTSKMNQVAWKDFIFDTRYSDQVDVFEGGFGYMRGIFRCENNSCMNYGIPYFNAMSRLEIMKRIREYSGTGFDMDYFYAHDTNKWGDTDGQTRSGAAHAYLKGNSITGSNTHRTPMRINPKKMGNSVRAIRAKNKSITR